MHSAKKKRKITNRRVGIEWSQESSNLPGLKRLECYRSRQSVHHMLDKRLQMSWRKTYSMDGCSVSDSRIRECIADTFPILQDIVRGNKEFDKKHLEQLVVKYGGDFCQKRTDDNEATIISSVDTSEIRKVREASPPSHDFLLSAYRKGSNTQRPCYR